MNEIYVYGGIDRWTAEYVNRELENKEPTTVHINSQGGDVFAALSIYNALRKHGSITIQIDGLCASAATLIAVGGDKVIMAENGLMMIHAPSVMLGDSYNASELEKLQTTLEKVEESIVKTYRQKVGGFELPRGELWLNAEQAKELGFVDEIAGAAQVSMTEEWLFVNALAMNIKQRNKEGLRTAMSTEKDMREQLKREIRQEELTRISALSKLKCDNMAVNALVEEAIKSGAKAGEILPYVEAVKRVPSTNFTAVIREQMASGADGVTGSNPAPDVVAAQIERIVASANRGKSNE